MSSRLAMLQMARIAPQVLGEATPLVAAYLLTQLHPLGGARDREGQADLWYTAFAFDGLLALDVALDPRVHGRWLSEFGNGRTLDLNHLACLARCWAALGGAPTTLRQGLREEVQRRSATTIYQSFMMRGAAEDLGLPAAPTIIPPWISGARDEESGFEARSGTPSPSTPTTAAAITMLRHDGAPVPLESARWLQRRLHADGGFLATPNAPMPDLLSTALALHALDTPERPVPHSVRDRCLDFIDTLWTGRAFCATWADDEVDAEYVYYALLALGHLR